jgi:16S rRNA (guanine966-N2)-methyltransferase
LTKEKNSVKKLVPARANDAGGGARKAGARSRILRIIAGVHRGRRLRFPAGVEIRPTPDRVRETLFNWLQPRIDQARVLDLFAGSGALGFEAASRGAKQVVMVERERGACAALEANRKTLAATPVEIVRADALDFLRGGRGVYDVVFLDPPFSNDLWGALFELLPRCLAKGAVVYRESGEQAAASAGWQVHKQGRAGQVSYQLLKRNETDCP